ncbi:hypothetical protein TH53_02180 [Pedobacter lusitanus]|uniref:Uncharacterized protein n=1 Tax=Pedobacter lusitanus TaxID=1503925 RepID=A0A0D0GW89_9SPHI|nr:hypothetical protein TH53_02180 [Pedobacter lusitanus]
MVNLILISIWYVINLLKNLIKFGILKRNSLVYAHIDILLSLVLLLLLKNKITRYQKYLRQQIWKTD